jgi:heme o synthase
VSSSALDPAWSARRTLLRDYLELTKPRITAMVMLTTLVGFLLPHAERPLLRLLATVAGTGLIAAGASALNMLLERRTDALMKRTQGRPLPAGRLGVLEALAWALALSSVGLAVLVSLAGRLAAAVALLTWLSYVFVYTPLKARTSLAIVIGAFPGALPPVIGWAAARGSLDPGAFILFAILFLWQIPHFLAIAWIYRDDYARAGLPMLPVLDPSGGLTSRQAVANSLSLLLVSLLPAAAGLAGPLYAVGALVFGLLFCSVAFWAAVTRQASAAQRLFFASLVYLPALYGLLLFDRR